MTRRHWPVRATLLAGLVLGVYTLALMITGRPGWLGVDYLVYELAAEAALAGEPFYDVPPEGFGFTYVYPPITVLVFVPFAVLPGWQLGFAAFTVTELLACVGIAWSADRLVALTGGAIDRIDRLLVVGFAAGSAAAIPNLFYAQVNHHLAFAIGAGLVALRTDHERLTGLAFGLVALFKVFPGVLGVWLLRRRAWVATGVATAVGAGGLLAGVILFGPEPTFTYLDTAVLGRIEGASQTAGVPAGAPYVSLRRASAAIWSGNAWLVTLVPVAILAVPLAILYRDVSTPLRSLLAAHATVAGMLLVIPAYVVYLVLVYPTLLALAYRLRGWARGFVLVGTLLIGVAYTPAAVRGHLESTTVGEALLVVVDPLLVFGSPPTYGLILSIIGCVAAWHRLSTPEPA